MAKSLLGEGRNRALGGSSFPHPAAQQHQLATDSVFSQRNCPDLLVPHTWKLHQRCRTHRPEQPNLCPTGIETSQGISTTGRLYPAQQSAAQLVCECRSGCGGKEGACALHKSFHPAAPRTSYPTTALSSPIIPGAVELQLLRRAMRSSSGCRTVGGYLSAGQGQQDGS